MKNIGYVLLLFIFLSACLPDEPGFDGFRRAEVQRLLSNQDSKRWSLDERFLFNEKISYLALRLLIMIKILFGM